MNRVHILHICFSFICAFLFHNNLKAATPDFNIPVEKEQPFSRAYYSTKPVAPNLKSLKVTANGEFDNPPAILLNGSDNITVSFDILGDDLDWLAYRIVYLDHQWRPSTISELEYLRGFNNTRIEDYASSFNTYVPYYHYNFSVPNDEVEMLLPGNYAIEVYRDGDPDDVVATACFSLYEKQVNVNPNLTTNTDVSFNREFQQMHIALDWRKASIVNPAADIFLVVDQNNRRDTERVITTPSRFSANMASYEHNRDLIFEAGNNYRRIEFVDHRYAGLGIERIRFHQPMYHVFVRPDKIVASNPYYYDRDQNGRFIIRQSDAEDSDTDADYMMVYFTLDYDNPFIEGAIFLSGEFTYDTFDESSKMIYNFEERRYEHSMLLKQGLYNYQYLRRPLNGGRPSTDLVEGNHHESGNSYSVKVFHRPPGQRYDRLIGYLYINN